MKVHVEHLRDGDLLPYADGAYLMDDHALPTVTAMLADLSEYAAIPQPRLWIQHSLMLNAMATGSSPPGAAVTLSTGLLAVLDRRDLRAVLTHEVGHIACGHVADKAAAAIQLARKAGLITVGAVGGAWVLAELLEFGGWAGLAVQGIGLVAGGLAGNALERKLASLSRSTELEADAFAAAAGGSGDALGSALRKLDRALAQQGGGVPDWQRVVSIVEPVDQYSTHPPTAARVAALASDRASMVGWLTCPTCWYAEDAGESRCRRCGTGLLGHLCGACVRRIEAADRICRHCGTPRPRHTCWQCDRPTSPDGSTCTWCGITQGVQLLLAEKVGTPAPDGVRPVGHLP